METNNEKMWLELKCGYTNVGPEGESIVDFAERWSEAIEEVLGEQTEHNFREAMDMSVSSTDIELISAAMFAEVLVILSQVWVYGEEFIKNLTYIERRLFESTISEKLQAMEEMAK